MTVWEAKIEGLNSNVLQLRPVLATILAKGSSHVLASLGFKTGNYPTPSAFTALLQTVGGMLGSCRPADIGTRR